MDNRLEIFHELRDPVAIWMESIFSKVQNVAKFNMQPIAVVSISFLCKFCCKSHIHFVLSHIIANKRLILSVLLGYIGSFLIHDQVGLVD